MNYHLIVITVTALSVLDWGSKKIKYSYPDHISYLGPKSPVLDFLWGPQMHGVNGSRPRPRRVQE